jgi:flagellar biosynthetic protein FlhB
MPDNNQLKTEQPTPRRLQEARRKGQVAKSTDLTAALILLGMVVLFYVSRDAFVDSTRRYLTGYFSSIINPQNLKDPVEVLFSTASYFLLLAMPVFVLAMVMAVAANLMQAGFVFSREALVPKLERLSITEGMRRMFSTRSLVELVKAILKLLVLGVLTYLLMIRHLPELLMIYEGTPEKIFQVVADFALAVVGYGSVVYLFLALLDYLYRRYEHFKGLRMSKQELKDELRQTEGDPFLKARQRERQRQIAMNRIRQEVPGATVVITNPTHLAIALRYKEGEDIAPRVVAKGAGHLAKRIIELAGEHKVPVVENREVARLLYRNTEVGQEIPVEFYQAVAEILAMIYRLNKTA